MLARMLSKEQCRNLLVDPDKNICDLPSKLMLDLKECLDNGPETNNWRTFVSAAAKLYKRYTFRLIFLIIYYIISTYNFVSLCHFFLLCHVSQSKEWRRFPVESSLFVDFVKYMKSIDMKCVMKKPSYTQSPCQPVEFQLFMKINPHQHKLK